ncbi:MAG: 30S ribosomal protein S13 [Nanoarchaeota archaeon]|nr:30S ribosomal protein S13 [Nanoarchaeota archaeon]MBU4300338.1 30S ribosomal protein S13 [Nanoarchaeota archaeon]MBU4452127.1 30S ribosomal protein S13 [Nanoarchaeota archaeon]MCG2724259.1 30S ribosomal protein S13 [archaeon]
MDPKKEAKKVDKGAQAAGDKAIKKEKSGKPDAKREAKQIIRIMSTDLDGAKKIKTTLCNIRGISYNFSHAVLYAAKIDGERKLGDLDEKDIETIEAIVKDPVKFGIPGWMLNHQFMYKTGETKHLMGADLMVTLRDEINRLKKIRSYRGVRHEMNLPVRGQRTRTAGRKGVKIGVTKKREEKSKTISNDKKK